MAQQQVVYILSDQYQPGYNQGYNQGYTLQPPSYTPAYTQAPIVYTTGNNMVQSQMYASQPYASQPIVYQPMNTAGVYTFANNGGHQYVDEFGPGQTCCEGCCGPEPCCEKDCNASCTRCCCSCCRTSTPGRAFLISIIFCYTCLLWNALGIFGLGTLPFPLVQTILSALGIIFASILVHPACLAAWDLANQEARFNSMAQWVHRALLLVTLIFAILVIVWSATYFGSNYTQYDAVAICIIPMYIFTPIVFALVLGLPWNRTKSCDCCPSGSGNYQTVVVQ